MTVIEEMMHLEIDGVFYFIAAAAFCWRSWQASVVC